MRPLRLVVLGWSLVLCAAVISCQGLNRSSGGSGLQGKIAWPRDGDLWVYDLGSGQQNKLTNLGAGAIVTGATWSPDGKRLIYAQFWRRPNERSSGADLFIANADGSNAHLFAERDAPNTALETPQWLPSGRVYYTTRRVTPQGRETMTIVRQTEGGQPEAIADNAYDPAVSMDESTLVYVRSTRIGQQMLKKRIGESGDGCELLSDQVFQYLSLPRIAPDGMRLALGGSGPPNMGPSGCGGNAVGPGAPEARRQAGGVGPAPASSAPAVDLLALLQPTVAYAHGLPADVYTLNLDGSALTRITDIKDDDPTVAWSADGGKIAIFGVGALYIVDWKGGTTNKLTDRGGYGGLDWTK